MTDLQRDWATLYAMQRSVRYYHENHPEVSWYWLLEWGRLGGKF